MAIEHLEHERRPRPLWAVDAEQVQSNDRFLPWARDIGFRVLNYVGAAIHYPERDSYAPGRILELVPNLSETQELHIVATASQRPFGDGFD